MIGERIRLVRQAIATGKKMSQEAFGESLGVTRDAIANIENGRVDQPSDLFIKQVCSLYGVDETWLRTGEGEMFRPLSREAEIAAAIGRILSEEDESFSKRFIAAVVGFDEDEWKLLEKMAKKLAGI